MSLTYRLDKYQQILYENKRINELAEKKIKDKYQQILYENSPDVD